MRPPTLTQVVTFNPPRGGRIQPHPDSVQDHDFPAAIRQSLDRLEGHGQLLLVIDGLHHVVLS